MHLRVLLASTAAALVLVTGSLLGGAQGQADTGLDEQTGAPAAVDITGSPDAPIAADVTPSVDSPPAGGSAVTSLAIEDVLIPIPPAPPSRIKDLNGGFLLLNMHGLLFHSDLADVRENLAYARWMSAGVVRVFATDNNSLKDWDGRAVGNRIADIAPDLRAANVKLIVALVNNHRPNPGEAPAASGWMDGYYQLLLPFYKDTWRGAYAAFTRDLITTVKARGVQDVIFAWELGNEIHTPTEPAAIIPFITGAVEQIRRLDADTPILPGTMGSNHLQPWTLSSPVARWLFCEAPVDAYTLHAYDWVSRDREGDMPISYDLDTVLSGQCSNGRKLPVIVEELGTSRELPNVYVGWQEYKRLDQELKQLRFVLSYPGIIGVGAWNGESPRVKDYTFYDNRRGLTSYGTGAAGGGSCYDPKPDGAPGVRCQLETVLRNLPKLP